MRIAILGNRGIGYVRPMTEGLSRMLSGLGVEHKIFWPGVRLLSRPSSQRTGISAQAKRWGKQWLTRPLLAQLKNYTAIIVVQHMRDAFRDSLAVDEIRRAMPDTPVILYDLDYLPTVGLWGPWLTNLIGGGTSDVSAFIPQNDLNVYEEPVHGMDRYDWYLCATTVGRCPMPEGFHPCTPIGLHLDDGTLYSAQSGRFVALVDFERPANLKERQMQLDALRETKTDFIILKGLYPMRAIREIYRQCSLYFLAHMESFGLPICELQACGSYVMTPYDCWCDAHRLGRHDAGLSPNFVCYHNDKDLLIERIQQIKSSPAPETVIQRFLQFHPHFFRGNPEALKGFLSKLERHEITSQSHREHAAVTSLIPVRPADCSCRSSSI
jgi:hypothetical protein